MKKINFKFFLITTLVFAAASSLFFASNVKILAQAQDEIIMSTTGYSVLSASSFVFGGVYSGNFDKKGFTTYFEYKREDSNLDVNAEETIKIVRDTDVEEFGDFYSSPELQLFSTYFFRAVGYFNDNPGKKFYGDVLNLRTGYIPIGATIPFTMEIDNIGNNVVRTYDPPICRSTQVLVNGVCEDKISDTDSNPVSNPTLTPSSILNPDSVSTTDSDSRLVPCGTVRDANNNITNPCGFNDIMTLINKVVKFILIDLALPIAAIMFAYAGFKLVTSGGETSKREEAKKIFTNVAIGLVIIAAAFLIVQTILSIAGYNTGVGINWFGF